MWRHDASASPPPPSLKPARCVAQRSSRSWPRIINPLGMFRSYCDVASLIRKGWRDEITDYASVTLGDELHQTLEMLTIAPFRTITGSSLFFGLFQPDLVNFSCIILTTRFLRKIEKRISEDAIWFFFLFDQVR